MTSSHAKTDDQGSQSLVVQWLRLQASIVAGAGLIPGRGAKISHAFPAKKKKRAQAW